MINTKITYMLFFFQRCDHKGVYEAPLRKTQTQVFHYQTGQKVRDVA